MITVFARMRVDEWPRFVEAHDRPAHMEWRQRLGNLDHHVLTQLDDATDVVILDTWSSPQDADNCYHSDEFERFLQEAGASLVELIKLEESEAAAITEGPPPIE